MQAIHLIEIGLAALVGGVVGATGYRFHARQQIELLKQRLQRSEEARNGAIERSNNAREQIAQLSKSISELRRAHQPARPGARNETPQSTPEERRAAAERALALASQEGPERSSGSKSAPVFANTEPMQY